MTTVRPWIGSAVFLATILIPVALRAQPAQEWASAAALGDVFQGTHDASGFPLIKVFAHGGGTNPTPKEQITLGSTAASIRGFAFVTESVATVSRYNLYVATDAGAIFKVSGTPTGNAHQATPVLQNLSPAINIGTLAVDEDGNLYVGFGGDSPRIDKYPAGFISTTTPVTYNVQCDVSPAPGLWFDLTARTPSGKQFAVIACGGKEVRYRELVASGATQLFALLPDLPGSVESARDLKLLAPIAALGATDNPDGIEGTQGGLAIAYGTNVQWRDRYGAFIGSFDFNDGPTSQNSWSSVAISPTGGAVWGAETNSSALTRFRLSIGFSQPERRFDSSSVLVTALAVNGEPRLAQAMQLININGAPATFLKNTTWRSLFSVQADLAATVRLAVTSFEARSGGTDADLNVNGRFNNFPFTTAVSASRGRANFYRLIKQSTLDISQLATTIAVDYIFPTTPTGLITGLYSDTNHSSRGFVQDNGGIDQVDKNIRTEWFQTQELVRGKTIGTNDFIVATQTGSPATLSFQNSKQLGSSLAIRAIYSFPVTDAFCASLVLTAARRGGPPWVIVGSSLTTLNDLGEGHPFFTPVGQGCGANLQVDANQSESGLPDFAVGRTYNLCVVSTAQAPNQTPVTDRCGTLLVK